MGTYDSLFAEDNDAPPVWLNKEANREAKAAHGSEYAALFDDAPAAPARPLPDSSNLAETAKSIRATRERLAGPDTLDAFGSGLRRGASFGFGDELEAGVRRAGDWLASKDGPSYAQYRDAIRARDTSYDAASPVASTVGDVAGGLVSGAMVPGMGAAAELSPGLRGLVQGASLGRSRAPAIAPPISRRETSGASRGTWLRPPPSGG
jgi:hypothetical protein